MTISTVGYNGSGPAQLALAVFLEVPVSEGTAFAYYHAFEFQFIAAIISQTTDWKIEEAEIIE